MPSHCNDNSSPSLLWHLALNTKPKHKSLTCVNLPETLRLFSCCLASIGISFSKYKTYNVDFELIWALIIDTPPGESE